MAKWMMSLFGSSTSGKDSCRLVRWNYTLTAPTARTDGPIIPDDLPDTRTEIPADSTTSTSAKSLISRAIGRRHPSYAETSVGRRHDLSQWPKFTGESAGRSDRRHRSKRNCKHARQALNSTSTCDGHKRPGGRGSPNNGETRDMFFASELITHAVPIDPNSTPLPVINEMSAANTEFKLSSSIPASATIDLAATPAVFERQTCSDESWWSDFVTGQLSDSDGRSTRLSSCRR